MKNLKNMLIALGLATTLLTGSIASAEGIGYIDTEMALEVSLFVVAI